MKELSYGEEIKLGDKVLINGKYRNVVHIDKDCSLVKINSRTFIQFPKTYSEEFKKKDDVDETSYVVYRG